MVLYQRRDKIIGNPGSNPPLNTRESLASVQLFHFPEFVWSLENYSYICLQQDFSVSI